MKKVNWGAVITTTAACAAFVTLVLYLFQQLRAIKEIKPELIGEIYDPICEN